ncbi:hypothetical protein L1887_57806 [Cichorium endivia]|nr:hypothetical protein L1887_57806 [Cichorium endivia]
MERRKEKKNAPSCGGDGWMMRMMGWWLRWSVLNARRSTKIQFGLALLCCAVGSAGPKRCGAVQPGADWGAVPFAHRAPLVDRRGGFQIQMLAGQLPGKFEFRLSTRWGASAIECCF